MNSKGMIKCRTTPVSYTHLKYVSITITDMTDLIPELLYYIKWAEYIQKLQEQGFTFAKASVYKEGENESDPYMMQARCV